MNEDPKPSDRIEELEATIETMMEIIAKYEAALREIKDQYLTPEQSNAIARTALAPEQDK